MAERIVFTLEEANALVRKLGPEVSEQFALRTEIESRLGALAKVIGEPLDLRPLADDSSAIADEKTALAVLVQRYESGWKEIEATGAVVKDLRIGLLDFYGVVDGEPVWLCWKPGEAEIGYFHGLDEGFSGRKPLRPSVRTRLLN